jgi:prophage antirepressor
MNELKVFNNNEFGDVRVVEVDNEPWFVGKDVAEILGYSNPRKALIDHVDNEDKGVTKCDTLGGIQEITTINESGLYSLILSSKLPNAKKFKKWVTNEVLPSIRKHGAYMTDNTLEEALTSPDFLIRLATELKNEKEARKKAEDKIAEDKPKVLFAEAVNASSTSILIGDLAKILKQNGYDTGQKRLFEILRNKGFLMKTGSSKNMPTQKAMEMGLFEVKETTINNPDGSIRITKTTKVTGAGQQYFINMFLAKAS